MMGDIDRHNALVLSIFGAGFLAFIVGYFVAWKSQRTILRMAGSLIVAASSGLFGLLGLAWLISAILPFSALGRGASVWPSLFSFLALSSVPLGLLVVSVKFFCRAIEKDAR